MAAETLTPPASDLDKVDQEQFEYSPEEFQELPAEARVCLTFFNEFRERTKEPPAAITQKVMELAGLEQDETRSAISELRTTNERHLRRLEFERTEDGSQFMLTSAGVDFIHKELNKLR